MVFVKSVQRASDTDGLRLAKGPEAPGDVDEGGDDADSARLDVDRSEKMRRVLVIDVDSERGDDTGESSEADTTVSVARRAVRGVVLRLPPLW
mmetsp:Transcript_7376/g.23588  ORF Transcript_7376/g.23588 Transcript_7376/m.23588 type:complete len:93 (-) Transcript_7376:1196-1474(-)